MVRRMLWTIPALCLLAALAGGVCWHLGAPPRRILLDYGRFRLLYDCAARSALRYDYSLGPDLGTAPRPHDFLLDPAMPPACGQQYSTRSYASVHAGYDRGHLVTSNHMDDDPRAIVHANYMTNIVPQSSRLNQGIWVAAENVAECYRDLAPLDVVGGVVYQDGAQAGGDDWFVDSHGIRTPEFFWKAIVTADPATGTMHAIAWYVPNRPDPGALDAYLVSLRELETLLEPGMLGIRVPEDVRDQKPPRTWPLQAGCSLSVRARVPG